MKVLYHVGLASTYDIAEALLWRTWYPSLGLRASVTKCDNNSC
jgi:hypothetical protein